MRRPRPPRSGRVVEAISRLKNRARREEHRENWARAVELYEEAIELSDKEQGSPPDVSLFNRIGDIHLRLGEREKAVSYYEQAIRHYTAQDLHTSAIALCNKVLRILPTRVGIYLHLGRLHAATGLAADARLHYRRFATDMIRLGHEREALDALEEFVFKSGDPEATAVLLEQIGESDDETAIPRLRSLRRHLAARGANPRAVDEQLAARLGVPAPRSGKPEPGSIDDIEAELRGRSQPEPLLGSLAELEAELAAPVPAAEPSAGRDAGFEAPPPPEAPLEGEGLPEAQADAASEEDAVPALEEDVVPALEEDVVPVVEEDIASVSKEVAVPAFDEVADAPSQEPPVPPADEATAAAREAAAAAPTLQRPVLPPPFPAEAEPERVGKAPALAAALPPVPEGREEAVAGDWIRPGFGFPALDITEGRVGAEARVRERRRAQRRRSRVSAEPAERPSWRRPRAQRPPLPWAPLSAERPARTVAAHLAGGAPHAEAGEPRVDLPVAARLPAAWPGERRESVGGLSGGPALQVPRTAAIDPDEALLTLALLDPHPLQVEPDRVEPPGSESGPAQPVPPLPLDAQREPLAPGEPTRWPTFATSLEGREGLVNGGPTLADLLTTAQHALDQAGAQPSEAARPKPAAPVRAVRPVFEPLPVRVAPPSPAEPAVTLPGFATGSAAAPLLDTAERPVGLPRPRLEPVRRDASAAPVSLPPLPAAAPTLGAEGVETPWAARTAARAPAPSAFELACEAREPSAGRTSRVGDPARPLTEERSEPIADAFAGEYEAGAGLRERGELEAAMAAFARALASPEWAPDAWAQWLELDALLSPTQLSTGPEADAAGEPEADPAGPAVFEPLAEPVDAGQIVEPLRSAGPAVFEPPAEALDVESASEPPRPEGPAVLEPPATAPLAQGVSEASGPLPDSRPVSEADAPEPAVQPLSEAAEPADSEPVSEPVASVPDSHVDQEPPEPAEPAESLSGSRPPTDSERTETGVALPEPDGPPARLDPSGGSADAPEDPGDGFHEFVRSAPREVLPGALLELEGRGEWAKALLIVDRLLGEQPDASLYSRKARYAVELERPAVAAAANLALGALLESSGEEAAARAAYASALELEPENGLALAAIERLGKAEGVAAAREPRRQDMIEPEPIRRDKRKSGVLHPPAARFGNGERIPESFSGVQPYDGVPGGRDATLDFEKLVSEFRAELAEIPLESDLGSRTELGANLKAMGLLDDAIRELQAAIREPDAPPTAYELLGEAFVEKGQPRVAARILSRALEENGRSDRDMLGVLYQLGIAYEQIQDHVRALDCYERVFSVDIDYRDVRDRIAACAA